MLIKADHITKKYKSRTGDKKPFQPVARQPADRGKGRTGKGV